MLFHINSHQSFSTIDMDDNESAEELEFFRAFIDGFVSLLRDRSWAMFLGIPFVYDINSNLQMHGKHFCTYFNQKSFSQT